ncbi:hypothetical protein B4U80_14993 [Leptotrombidium deliense]|uniref:Uncharacterized protein n=1 Tax=Leptotrombidium deliense TaxID=299467 RepID=A0A443RUK3_9ACAR|nr:hypothetical protein B4U80_14993 [Leptotrombidium deliense]
MIDRITEIEIVTADGMVRLVNNRQNRELFWASKGSGGGILGIETKVKFRLFQADNRLVTVKKQFSRNDFAGVFNRWQRWVATNPSDSITSIFQLSSVSRVPQVIFVEALVV